MSLNYTLCVRQKSGYSSEYGLELYRDCYQLERYRFNEEDELLTVSGPNKNIFFLPDPWRVVQVLVHDEDDEPVIWLVGEQAVQFVHKMVVKDENPNRPSIAITAEEGIALLQLNTTGGGN